MIGDYEPCNSSNISFDDKDDKYGILSAISLPIDGGNFFIYETSASIQDATYSEDRLKFSLKREQDQHYEVRFDQGYRYDDIKKYESQMKLLDYLVIVRGGEISHAWITSTDSCRRVLSIRGSIIDGCLTSRWRLWLLMNLSDEESMTKVVCMNTADPLAQADEQMAWSKLQ